MTVDEMNMIARRRTVLLKDLDLPNLSGIEIGALDKPMVRKSDGPITYVDHATTDALIDKYTGDKNVNIADIVAVDAVWGANTLGDAIGLGVADYVIASHVVEHVPDFLGWMREVQSALRSGGQLLLVVPDRRMSFDCRRQDTKIASVLEAYIRKARKPETRELLDCILGTAVSDGMQLYRGEKTPEDFPFTNNIDYALRTAQAAHDWNVYVDVHCWVFTPKSFASLMVELVENGLIGFACSGFTDTVLENGFEFFVKLQTGSSKDEAIESWRSMERKASLHVIGSAAHRQAESASIVSEGSEKARDREDQAIGAGPASAAPIGRIRDVAIRTSRSISAALGAWTRK